VAAQRESASARDPLQAWVYAGVLVLITGWVLHLGRAVFVPATLGALLVYVILGLTRLSGRLPVVGPRLPASMRALVAIVLAFAAVALVVSTALANLDRLAARWPEYQARLLASIQAFAERLGAHDAPTWDTLRAVAIERGHVGALIGTTVSAGAAIIAGVTVVLLYMVFLLVERDSLPGKLARIVKDPAHAVRLRAVVADINRRVGTYLALKALLGAIQAAASYAVMRAFGLEFASFWAMLILLFNFVPYLGSILSVLLPVAMGVVQFGDPPTVLLIALALGAVQFVVGNFVDPWLLGNSLNLSPLVILVSLSVWSSLWGVAGAFLAVPVTATLAIVLSEFAATRPVAVLLSRDGRLGDEDDRAGVAALE
jgi:predicted PurR-regulated permease PerM